MEKDSFTMDDRSGNPSTLNYRHPTIDFHGEFHVNWEFPMDQSVQYHSAMSSIVSSPTSSAAGDGVAIKELIGRLGSICNSNEISPQSQTMGNYVVGTSSANTSCYSTPLGSPPSLNLGMEHSVANRNLLMSANSVGVHNEVSQFLAEPTLVERAAKFSNFRNRSSDSLGFHEGNLSRVSSSQSLKSAAQMSRNVSASGNLPEMEMRFASDCVAGGSGGPDRNFSRLSRDSTSVSDEAGFAGGREDSTASDHAVVAEFGLKVLSETGSRKRKTIQGKQKDAIPSASCKQDELEESKTKKAKGADGRADEGDETKKKSEQKSGADVGDGNQKQLNETQKPPEPPKQDYIHVRARRGQATDSHSLAERVRREKISERMKFLQDLVPGCNKVIGKAVMLDEIINYVQSLQRQVEFLSMKLASLNPQLHFNMEEALPKDILQSCGPSSHMYPLDASASAFPYGNHHQQGSITFEMKSSANQLDSAMSKSLGMQLPLTDGYGDASSQLPPFWVDELQSVVHMGFEQNQEAAFTSQDFHGSFLTSHMKIEI